jgi:N-acetylglucosamine-6-phosphate deacetylase
MVTDLQVNGYAGVDFNQPGLTGEDLRRACAALRRDGTGRILATVITHAAERMAGLLRHLAALRAQDALIREVIAGFHVEGPFLNPAPGYIGAHPAAHAIPGDPGWVEKFFDASGGLLRLLTLAPECDPDLAATRRAVELGVHVAAGHTNASLDQLDEALDAGLTHFTHFGNGCPAELPRHDNILQRVLHRSSLLTCTFIADGVHVPAFALENYLRGVPPANVIIVSDAMAAAGAGPGTYRLGEAVVEVGPDGIPRAPGSRLLAGSASSLARMAQWLTGELGQDPTWVRFWTEEHPDRVLEPKT